MVLGVLVSSRLLTVVGFAILNGVYFLAEAARVHTLDQWRAVGVLVLDLDHLGGAHGWRDVLGEGTAQFYLVLLVICVLFAEEHLTS